MFSPPRTLTLEGQEFVYNEESHTVVLEIIQPFMKAGELLGWNSSFGLPGLGINKSIIKFVEQSKSHLLVRVLSNSNQNQYWINHDEIKQFVRNNYSEYVVSGKTINVIPWKLFAPKPHKETPSC
jgi:hypothetical protein